MLRGERTNSGVLVGVSVAGAGFGIVDYEPSAVFTAVDSAFEIVFVNTLLFAVDIAFERILHFIPS